MHGTLPKENRLSKRRRPKSRATIPDPQPIVFRDVARLAFPLKTVEALGHFTGCSRSTIQTWLSGEHEPPAYVLAIVFAQIMKKLAGQ